MKGNKGRQKNPSFKPVQYIDKRLLRAIFLIRRHFGRQIYVHCTFFQALTQWMDIAN